MVTVPEVTEVLEHDGVLFFKVLDTLGREFTFSFEERAENEYAVHRVYLPDGITWNVSVFQEMVDVRDHVTEHFENLHYELGDGSFDLDQIRYYGQDPLPEN